MKAEEILKRYATGERNFPAANLIEASLSGVNLSKANLSGADLSVANLCGSNLSDTNLSHAKLNVARLSGANLSRANLYEANLNVANLALADLSKAEMRQASLVRAEMARAELSGANISYANLSGADLKDARLRSADLSYANLNRADLKWATFTNANLTQANLHGADLSNADLSNADLSKTELRQANLSQANLRGANLSGANLRWADLSGADLSWADLSGARLSGANLTGADLSHANLLETILVHTDLTQANLIDVDWAGADLSGATLTGAKLHGVLRFGIKTEGMLCEWVDLSPTGDQSIVHRLTSASLKTFFHETSPTVRIAIDNTLDPDAHYALAAAYYHLAQQHPVSLDPPSILVSRRRTTVSFEMRSDNQLFLAAYIAILPFKDARYIRENLISLLELVQSADVETSFRQSERVQQLTEMLSQTVAQASEIDLSEIPKHLLEKIKFFHSPTQTTLITSSNCALTLYSHPRFGKRLKQDGFAAPPAVVLKGARRLDQLNIGGVIDFLQGFQELEECPEPSTNPSTSSIERS
ncbi:MAG: hypothetical protein HC866_10845 [Leptolyngbyaceae cyanobacterium RU_5_1]|nr:hypothetical protein [Leptolyngbyaceae cyanobacterium RU_5_1]